MPKIGVPELAIILVIVLLIFGAGKLPQIGNAIGKSIREFKKAKDGEQDPGKTSDREIAQSAGNIEKPKV